MYISRRREAFPLIHVILLAATASHTALAAATCYAMNGLDSEDSSLAPCDPGAQQSACCSLSKANPDVCLSSGLCYAQIDGYSGLVYANGCTDVSGKSAACPHFCDGLGLAGGSFNVLQCNIGQYCCRDATDTTNCCGDSTVLKSNTDIGFLLTATAPTPVTSATASVSSAATAAGQEAACVKDKSAVVGGAVGGILGAALLASVGALIFVSGRKSKRMGDPPDHPDHPASGSGTHVGDVAGVKDVYPANTEVSYSPMAPHGNAAESPATQPMNSYQELETSRVAELRG